MNVKKTSMNAKIGFIAVVIIIMMSKIAGGVEPTNVELGGRM